MDRQAGLVSRRQFNELGGRHSDVERLVRRRQLDRLVTGVLIAPTDQPSWHQRAWAGVLHFWPAALAGESALRAVAGPGWRRHDDSAPITIAVGGDRSIHQLEGYATRKMRALDVRTDWDAAPPRLRPEEAALDVASRAADLWAGVGVLSTVIDLRGVDAAVLKSAADRRARLRNALWLRPLLRDLERGRPLMLERLLHEQVEDPHGLPRGRRWRHPRGDRPDEPGITAFAYPPHRLRLELDGRLRHDSAGRHDRELDAQLAAAAAAGHARRTEVVLSYGQVLARPCATAGHLATLLARRGWSGALRPCSPGCTASRH